MFLLPNVDIVSAIKAIIDQTVEFDTLDREH